VSDKLERMRNDKVVAYFNLVPQHFPGAEGNHETLGQDSRPSGGESKWRPLEYNAGALRTQTRRPVAQSCYIKKKRKCEAEVGKNKQRLVVTVHLISSVFAQAKTTNKHRFASV
jgi:hypothetical protein